MRCEVTLGDDAPAICGAGAVVQIPPGLLHRVVATRSEPLRFLVLYSLPLGPRYEQPID